MKRESILIYLKSGKFYVFLNKAKKEIIEEIDTSSFFEFEEIRSVEKFSEFVSKFIVKNNITNLIKPKLFVLYNEISHSDIVYLYKMALEEFNYSEIEFIKIGFLISKIEDSDRIVFNDSGCFTSFKFKKKSDNITAFSHDSIIVGDKLEQYIHYSDENLIWNSFKSHFTK